MRMWHGDGPLVPPSDLEFLYSPSAAQVALMCTPCRRQSPKRVNRNHMACPKGTNPGHIIYPKKKASFGVLCEMMQRVFVGGSAAVGSLALAPFVHNHCQARTLASSLSL